MTLITTYGLLGLSPGAVPAGTSPRGEPKTLRRYGGYLFAVVCF